MTICSPALDEPETGSSDEHPVTIAKLSDDRAFLSRTRVCDLAEPMPDYVASGPVMLRQISHQAQLDELISALDETPMLAVVDERRVVVGVISRTCTERLPFRCWLFGLISLLESRIRDDLGQAESWRSVLSPERLAKARDIKRERQRRGHTDADTLLSLQFGDLAMASTKVNRRGMWSGITSRRAQKRLFRQLEQLRNALAHCQRIGEQDWGAVVVMAEHLDHIVTTGSLPSA